MSLHNETIEDKIEAMVRDFGRALPQDVNIKSEVRARIHSLLASHTEEIVERLGTSEMLEKFAEIEHDQWSVWSRNLATVEKLSDDRLDRWVKLWIPYSKLTDEEKEQDRVYARKVIKNAIAVVEKKQHE